MDSGARDGVGGRKRRQSERPLRELQFDDMYGVLGNRRRRLVLHYLLNTEGHSAVLGTMATQIAAWENDVPVSAITSRLRKRTYNTLQQTHHPTMARAGLVEYDRNRGTVALTADPHQLRLVLAVLPRSGSRWTRGFLLAGFVLWLLLALNWAAVHVFSLYRPGSAAVLSALSLLLVFVGFVHLYRVVW